MTPLLPPALLLFDVGDTGKSREEGRDVICCRCSYLGGREEKEYTED
jgi:hypothetical protein